MATHLEHRNIPPLLKCPSDVLDLILNPLSPAVHARLCSVNKSLQGFIEPNLYANIHWNWLSDCQPTFIVLFVRSVVRRPQLGRHIRSLALMGVSPKRSRGPEGIPKSISQNDMFSTIASTLNELLETQVTSDKTWIDLLRAGSMDALVALLIAHLPNLTSLHLGPRFTRDNACLGLVLRADLCDPVDHSLPRFEHLRTVIFNAGRYIRSERLVRQTNAANVLAFFYLPSIEHIHTSFDGSGAFAWPGRGGQAPVCHHLTELDLGIPIRACYLGNILSVAPKLKSLQWDWYHEGVTTPFGDDKEIDLDQIAAALSLVRESLTELTITAKCTLGANKQFPRSSSKGSLQSLADFPAMKSFQAPIAFLMGWSRDKPRWELADVLPKTIESVTIMDNLWYHHDSYVWNERAMLEVVKAWLANAETLPPNLQYFELHLKHTLQLDVGTVWNELTALGARVGVKVKFRYSRGRVR